MKLVKFKLPYNKKLPDNPGTFFINPSKVVSVTLNTMEGTTTIEFTGGNSHFVNVVEDIITTVRKLEQASRE